MGWNLSWNPIRARGATYDAFTSEREREREVKKLFASLLPQKAYTDVQEEEGVCSGFDHNSNNSLLSLHAFGITKAAWKFVVGIWGFSPNIKWGCWLMFFGLARWERKLLYLLLFLWDWKEDLDVKLFLLCMQNDHSIHNSSTEMITQHFNLQRYFYWELAVENLPIQVVFDAQIYVHMVSVQFPQQHSLKSIIHTSQPKSALFSVLGPPPH